MPHSYIDLDRDASPHDYKGPDRTVYCMVSEMAVWSGGSVDGEALLSPDDTPTHWGKAMVRWV